jgi:membrane-bound lytic murein transglycosylase F
MIKTLLIILLCGILSACQPVDIHKVDIAAPAPKRTVLKVGTLYGPQIYLNSELGESGFDFEMAQRFADYLALPLEMIPYTNRKQLFAALTKPRSTI